MTLAPRNLVSLVGVVLATAAAALFVVLAFLESFGLLTNPYLGLVVFVAVPTLFVFGLLLIPIGAWWAGRRRRRGVESADWPVIDLRQPRYRLGVFLVFALTVINLAIVSVAAYGGIHYMDSSSFCGQVCHTTMEPQYVAHQNGPHARVACAQCHVAPGAAGFVQAKLAGVHQLRLVATNQVPRPVPSPPAESRPARGACEQCHWPGTFRGDIMREIREYSDDEQNSESVTRLRMHVGGGSAELGVGVGIHWHMNLDNRIEFIANGDTVPWVRATDRAGAVREYFADGVPTGQRPAGVVRRMDCMDCHNRAAHAIQPSAARAVDEAIGRGQIPRALPFVRRETVTALTTTYPDAASARAGIASRLQTFYRDRGADAQLVARSIDAAQRIWSQNVFPQMKVTWGTYPSQIGHVDTPGCFRCHDDAHKTSDGRAIKQDCELCHMIVEN